MPKEKRIKLQLRKPNPLFEHWLQKWLNIAISKNSRRKHNLFRALDSLRKYPLPLNSGRDCIILEGFGRGICQLLDNQLEIHKKENSQKAIPTEQEQNEQIENVLKIVKKKLITKQENQQIENQSICELFKKYDFENTISLIDQLDAGPSTDSVDARVIQNQFLAGSFEIILTVDTQETVGKSKRMLDTLIKGLNEKNVKHEVRRLNVGDFIWICRDKKTDRELVLPFIIERKRMDDFASSIKDGRFHEQKFRLSNCGLENVIYLIENYGSNQHVGLPIQNLLQASINTIVHNKFSVKFTESQNDTIFYLSILTNLLIKKYKDKTLFITSKMNIKDNSSANDGLLDSINLMTFKEFNESSIKLRNFKIHDLFIRQLIQLKSLSIDKAIAITKVYPTPKSLILAYNECNNDVHHAENLLSNITFGNLKKSIGPAISKIVYQFYNLK